jgi:hypothetical protein
MHHKHPLNITKCHSSKQWPLKTQKYLHDCLRRPNQSFHKMSISTSALGLELNSHNVVKKQSPKYDIEYEKEYIEIESDATKINENA